MRKILIVEDNEMNREMLTRRLERRGYEIVIAVDGATGLDVARAEKPDLILMDMSLPVVDGWEATRLLKDDPRLKEIPVIALTGDPDHSGRIAQAGFDSHFRKPVEGRRAEAEIARLLGR